MSHDRKPGRVRVVQAADKSPKRRRGEGGAGGKRAGGSNKGGQKFLIVLFLLASIGSAVGVELLLPA